MNTPKRSHKYSVWPVGRDRHGWAHRIRANSPEMAIETYVSHLGSTDEHIRPPRVCVLDEGSDQRWNFDVVYHTALTCTIEEIADV